MNRVATPLIPLALLLIGTHSLAPIAVHAAEPSTKQSAFYCDRGALTPEKRKRHFDVLGPALAAKRAAVHELADGYEFQFSSDDQTYQQVAEWVDGERLCCPFFDFTVRVSPEGGPMWLRLTGRPGTKQFIQADGAEWLKPVRAQK